MTASIGGLAGRMLAGITANPVRSSLIAGGAVATAGLLVGCSLSKPRPERTSAAGQQVLDITPRELFFPKSTTGSKEGNEQLFLDRGGIAKVYAGDSVSLAATKIMNVWDKTGPDGARDGVVDLRTETFTADNLTALSFFQHVDKDHGNGDAKVGYDELYRLLDSVDTDVEPTANPRDPKSGHANDGTLNDREITRLREDHHWFKEALLTGKHPEGRAEGKLVLPAYGDVSGR